MGETDVPLFDVLGPIDEGETAGLRDQTTDQQDIVAVPKSHARSDDRDIPREPIQQTQVSRSS